jgi:hypothetical protein
LVKFGEVKAIARWAIMGSRTPDSPQADYDDFQPRTTWAAIAMPASAELQTAYAMGLTLLPRLLT